MTRGLVQTPPRSFGEGRVWESLETVTGSVCGTLDRQKRAGATVRRWPASLWSRSGDENVSGRTQQGGRESGVVFWGAVR